MCMHMYTRHTLSCKHINDLLCVYLFGNEYLKDIHRLELYAMGCTRESPEKKDIWMGLFLWLRSTMTGFVLSINCFVQYKNSENAFTVLHVVFVT